MSWYTKTEYVDIETGETLTKKHIEKKIYIKIKLQTKYEKQHEYSGTRHNTWVCTRNPQQEIKW